MCLKVIQWSGSLRIKHVGEQQSLWLAQQVESESPWTNSTYLRQRKHWFQASTTWVTTVADVPRGQATAVPWPRNSKSPANHSRDQNDQVGHPTMLKPKINESETVVPSCSIWPVGVALYAVFGVGLSKWKQCRLKVFRAWGFSIGTDKGQQGQETLWTMNPATCPAVLKSWIRKKTKGEKKRRKS